MKPFIVLLVYTLVFASYSSAAVCQSLGNGNWNTPSTWSCGTLPTGGDQIRIMAGDTVSISTVTNILGPSVTLTIDGVFLFDNPSAKLRLPCGSIIIITASGSIESTGVGQPSHSIRICRDEVWSGSDGTLTGPLVIGVILPIELTFFDAESSADGIDFTWQTASEKDNDYFTIEGSSDGVNWRSMHEIAGAGTTQELQDYSFSSLNEHQFQYFRLKQTDFDGQFSYSDVVFVPFKQREFCVYPNPSNGSELTIDLGSVNSGIAQIIRYDGRVVYSEDIQGSKRLTGLNLKSGAYIVQVQGESEVETKRFIVQ
jgi:hypothetical protein